MAEREHCVCTLHCSITIKTVAIIDGGTDSMTAIAASRCPARLAFLSHIEVERPNIKQSCEKLVG